MRQDVKSVEQKKIIGERERQTDRQRDTERQKQIGLEKKSSTFSLKFGTYQLNHEKSQ